MKALVFVTALAAVACGSSPSPVGPALGGSSIIERPVGNRDPDGDPLGLQVRSAFDRVAPLIVD